jgi:hypothetical protein
VNWREKVVEGSAGHVRKNSKEKIGEKRMENGGREEVACECVGGVRRLS